MEFEFPWPLSQGEWLAWMSAAITVLFGLILLFAPRLALRGLMAIPAPHPDSDRRRAAFRAMRAQFEALAARYAQADTLSMGMSEDLELAIAEGATMVRIGTALFGERPAA